MCVITQTRKTSTNAVFFHVRPGITTRLQIKPAKLKRDVQGKCKLPCIFLGFRLHGTIKQQTWLHLHRGRGRRWHLILSHTFIHPPWRRPLHLLYQI